MGKKINIDGINKAALTIRSLAMDAVQKAGSGHPGLPMGLAELGASIYGEVLSHYPADPAWMNRDRFVLSAGHGSMLLYALLYLSGYGLTLDDLKQFRQLGSLTPGHPEFGRTKGVETSTGPLGQGFSNAVGMAIAEKALGYAFNTPEHKVMDHYTYALASDGDIMEGISAESGSLAGHLGLGKLIVFYDSNKITIDGSTSLSFSEDVGKRFEAYNWHVQQANAYDVEALLACVEKAKAETGKPSLVIVTSVIAKGAANLEGTSKAHGAPLGEAEVKATKEKLGLDPNTSFYVDKAALDYFESRKQDWEKGYKAWKATFEAWSLKNPELAKKWNAYFGTGAAPDVDFPKFAIGEKLATRVASGKILNAIAKSIPNLIGGSADLAASNNTLLSGMGEFSAGNPGGRNLYFGIREHAMGGICNGIALHGGLRPYCATFLIFSDYMRPSVRLASLMKLPVIYVFTHDSIYVGEDGPTHEPVEQIAALRLIPGMTLIRPADAEESVLAYRIALEKKDGPVALALTRQNLEVFPKPSTWMSDGRKGAYVADDSNGTPELVIVASGSEVGLAIKAKAASKKTAVRVVSMMSLCLFKRQDDAFKNAIIPRSAKKLFLEAGVTDGWGQVASDGDRTIGINEFGESGQAAHVANHFGFTEQKVADEILKILGKV